ncbi:hypothetical protein G7046_g119 [Stylonectria norvegica]|nr:hypothetical protein G7046_g119 [Stylonectria norvegica]
MGNNLSSTVVPDTSADVLAPKDRANTIRMAVIWAGALYACAIIFSTCALVDRWKGPYDRVRTGPSSVLGAFLLSTAWPVVMVYLMITGYGYGGNEGSTNEVMGQGLYSEVFIVFFINDPT